MVCSDKSFFKLNTKIRKLLEISTGPAAENVSCFLANDDGWLSSALYHLNSFPTVMIITVS